LPTTIQQSSAVLCFFTSARVNSGMVQN
jgi:hypothetical protein